jgi:GT2 family glycosyltransferase
MTNPMHTPSVYIILVTYNMKTAALRCLASLRNLTYPDARVVVVDNGSEDGTEVATRSRFPEVTVIQTGKNLGYTGGNNCGIRYALDAGADYTLILNPDTVLANPDFLTRMVEHLEQHARVGIAGPRVFLREPGRVQNTVLFAPGLWRNIGAWVGTRLHPRSYELSGSRVVDAEVLNGVCLLMRSACLREIGLFDENIFMYVEDVDLDDRARRRGWLVRYLPIDSIVHEQKVDGYHITSTVNFLIQRNSVYYLAKIGKRMEAWGYSLLSLALTAVRALLPSRCGSFGDYMQFCRRLMRAYRQILSGGALDESFGPPYAF